MKDVARELDRRQEELLLRLRANLQRVVDTTLAEPGADALGVVRRHPVVSLGGAGLAGVIAGKFLRAGGTNTMRAAAAVLGAGLRYAGPLIVSALTGPRR